MTAPELAEVTAARAYLTDYGRQVGDGSGRGQLPYQDMAMRLAKHLQLVLDALSSEVPRPRADGSVGMTCVLPDGTASIAMGDIGIVLSALKMAAEAGDTADRHRYSILSRALGGSAR